MGCRIKKKIPRFFSPNYSLAMTGLACRQLRERACLPVCAHAIVHARRFQAMCRWFVKLWGCTRPMWRKLAWSLSLRFWHGPPGSSAWLQVRNLVGGYLACTTSIYWNRIKLLEGKVDSFPMVPSTHDFALILLKEESLHAGNHETVWRLLLRSSTNCLW